MKHLRIVCKADGGSRQINVLVASVGMRRGGILKATNVSGNGQC